jgi:transcriptional regulator with XRE-family HTH domain
VSTTTRVRCERSTTANVSALGNWLRDHRRRLGKEQDDIAVAVGVTQQTVSRWENGEATPRGRYILPLANALGVSREAITDQIIHAHNSGATVAETLDLDQRVMHLENELTAMRSEVDRLLGALRQLLGDG